ncbi:MAG TPA: bifunctional phosphoglucose/phosphomannose isomerase [archaeon]|nr:bifunctional phosphoglucose/phosphomannose isomerase [archaeon]
MIDDIRSMISVGKDVLKSKIEVPNNYRDVSNVVFSGMGGSAIASDIVKDLVEDTFDKPIHVYRKEYLPKFADKNTLLVSISYSGNTIETIAVLKEAIKRKCKIFGMTSGGQMENIFKENKMPFVKLPTGFMPRVALGYGLFNLINLFKELGWIKIDFDLDSLNQKKEKLEKMSIEIAKKLKDKLTIIYSDYFSVAHRFKSQLNENSKAEARYDIIPELCHNEINSWGNLNGKSYIVFLRDRDEPKESKTMVEIIKKMLKPSDYTEVISEGKDKLTRMLYLIWLGDFISYYLAKERNWNPGKIPQTDFLKKELSQVKF